MLERMSRLGVLEDLACSVNPDEATKKRLIAKSMALLVQSEYIRPDIAAIYLNTLVSVFEWNIEVEIPRESSAEKMRFDSERYVHESQDRDFLMGRKEFDAENFDEARLLFSRAYGKGNVLAGVHLGEMYYSEIGCARDLDKAIPLFVDGRHRGCPLGAGWLAQAYKHGKGVPKDVDKAKEVYESCLEALEAMCASGSSDAQYVLGFNLLYGNFVTKNDKKAIYWLEKAMNAGHVAAGVEIAKTYLNGWGRAIDTDMGVRLLEKYSHSTNKRAHYELGKIYYYGSLCEQDYKKALALFLYAAERGDSLSQYFVGDIYYWGNGVDRDYAEARKWYELAENHGNKDASKFLGFIYFLVKVCKKITIRRLGTSSPQQIVVMPVRNTCFIISISRTTIIRTMK